LTIDDSTLRADWLPLAASSAEPQAWERLDDWTRGAAAQLPADVVPLLRDHRTHSARELALIGLALAKHHAYLGEPAPLDVSARLLLGAHRLHPGPLRDACAALVTSQEVALYREVADKLADLDPTSAEYYVGSLLLSLVSPGAVIARAATPA
jgi:hypothetical protein